MDVVKILPPGSTIGILGGGQLGRMTALAAARLGYRCIVYAPDEHSIAGDVAAGHVRGGYEDAAALARFATEVDVVTYEFENVPEAAVTECRKHRPVRPGVKPIHCRPAPAAREGILQGTGHRHRSLAGDRQRGRDRVGDRPARHPQDLHRGL